MNTFSEDYKGAIQNNIFDHLFAIAALVLKLKDSDCLSLGVKAGAILRKLFSYKFIIVSIVTVKFGSLKKKRSLMAWVTFGQSYY